MSKRCKRRSPARAAKVADVSANEPSDGFGLLLALLCTSCAVPLLIVGAVVVLILIAAAMVVACGSSSGGGTLVFLLVMALTAIASVPVVTALFPFAFELERAG